MWRQELPLRSQLSQHRVCHQRHDPLGVRVQRPEVLGRVAHVRAQVEVGRGARGAGQCTQGNQIWRAAGTGQFLVGGHR